MTEMTAYREATIHDVFRWLADALAKAKEDKTRDYYLSFRELRISVVYTGDVVRVAVGAGNRAFLGAAKRYRRMTTDGAEVVLTWYFGWNDLVARVPTGADWLPEEFVRWMKEGEVRLA
jgi:hypothetical protein